MQNRSFIVQKGETLFLSCHLTPDVTNGEVDATVPPTNGVAPLKAGSLPLRWISEADVFTKTKFVSILYIF